MKYTKAMRIADFYSAMEKLGFTYGETEILRRAQMTLHRWAERECNGEIERDEETGNVYSYRGNYVQANDPRRKQRVADLETGALFRINSVIEARNDREEKSVDPDFAMSYHQTDPRGCALYVVLMSQTDGKALNSVYNRGFGVCY